MPQDRGELSDEHRRHILAAREAVDATQVALELAVADALKSGASVREVTRLTGVSHTTVQKYGHMHGWPTEEQRAARQVTRDSHDAFEARLRAAEAMMRLYEDSDSDTNS